MLELQPPPLRFQQYRDSQLESTFTDFEAACFSSPAIPAGVVAEPQHSRLTDAKRHSSMCQPVKNVISEQFQSFQKKINMY
jgi:hypothetical protein